MRIINNEGDLIGPAPTSVGGQTHEGTDGQKGSMYRPPPRKTQQIETHEGTDGQKGSMYRTPPT